MLKRNANVLNQQYSKYFLPTVLMTMALSMSVVVDGIIVGNALGAQALAAVNVVMPVMLVFNAIYALIGVGGSTLYSVAIGKRDTAYAGQLFSVSLFSMLVISALVCVLGLAFIQPLGMALTANAPELTQMVVDYMRVLFMGVPVFVLVPGLVYFLRAAGKPKLASVVLILANVINLGLDLLFILVLDLGIAGAGMATVTGYLVGLIIVVVAVARTKELKPVKPASGYIKTLGAVSATGMPSALSTGLNFLRLTCINQLVMLALGSDGVSAFSVCMSCLSLTSMFVSGSAQTMIPFLGTLYGEKDIAGVKITIKHATQIVFIASLVLLAVFEIFPTQISMMFGLKSVVQIGIAEQAIRIFSLSLPVLGLLFIATCVYQVLGRRTLSSLVPLLENGVFIIFFAWLFSKLWGATGIWVAFPTAEVLTLLVIAIITWFIRKKDSKKMGILLLDKEDAQLLDLSIQMETGQATELSSRSVEFCRQNGMDAVTANKVGVAIEEISIYTIKNSKSNSNNKNGWIDVRVSIANAMAAIAVRDNGDPLDPMLGIAHSETGEIDLLLAIAQDVKYDRILGMNCTLIKIAL